ncbi:hypothetical protein NX059_000520 [Plenodomus lindquistii]|nr:hypothetical protein NX059_000520 [Plenodomus lindquistii]
MPQQFMENAQHSINLNDPPLPLSSNTIAPRVYPDIVFSNQSAIAHNHGVVLGEVPSTSAEFVVLLDRYQRLMAPSMPFVVILTSKTAATITASKPFLTQVIAGVASFHSTEKQLNMVKGLMREVSAHADQ